MEESELEEGEAYSGPEDDAAIDPDTALSYIDEKLQNVLGHFQKDFEGGVCAENLGAKFGGYGSFLPVHQRSPSILSHSKSPKISNYSSSISPSNAQFEGAPQKIDAATIPSVSLQKNSFCTEQRLDNLGKKDTYGSTPNTGESSPQHGFISKQTNSNDQKTPMVRVKMGPEKGLVRNNAAIYSGLGLDVSPSSSLEDIVDGSLGSSPKSQVAPIDSPMMIFQFYTCFRVPPNGSTIHSPVSKSLLHVLEKVQFKDCKMVGGFFSHGSSTMPSGEIPPKRNVKGSSEKISKLAEKNCKLTEVKKMKSKDEGNDISALFGKEIDIETPAGRELVSDALNISILSGSISTDEEAFKGVATKWGPQVVTGKDQSLSTDIIQDKLESVTSLDANKFGNGGTVSSHIESKQSMKPLLIDNNSLEDRRGNVLKDDAITDPQKVGKVTEYEGYKVSKDRFVGPAESVILKAPQRTVSCEQDGGEIRKHKEKTSSGKRRSVEGQTTDTPSSEFSKEYADTIGSAPKKDKKKNMHSKADHPDCKSKVLKSQRDSNTILDRDYHTNNAVLAKNDQAGKTDEHEFFSREKQKDLKFEYNKDDSLFAEKIKEKPGRQICENLPVSERYDKVTSSSNPLGVETFSTVPPPSSHVIKENWVGCDRCSKWRLLPYGTDTSHLPQKWVCSMLTWLPGMNKCNITEEETTKALHASYQLPVPEGLFVTNGHRDVANSGVVIADSQHLQNNHDSAQHAIFSVAKKKPKIMDVPIVPGQLNLVQTTNPSRENQEFPMQSRSLGDMKSNVLNKSVLNESMLTDITAENQNNKQREKKKVPERFSYGGGVSEQNGRAKSKRRKEFDQNGSRTSKKVEMHEPHFSDVDCPSNHDIGEMSRTNIVNGFLSKPFVKSFQKYKDSPSSKDSNFVSKRASPAVREMMKAPVNATTSGEMKEQHSNLDLEKLKENRIHPRAIDLKEESSETEHRREKKMRISKSGGRELSASTLETQADKNSQSARIHLPQRNQLFDGIMESRTYNNKDHYLSQRSTDGIDSLKKDYSCAQPSTAATSSSSKVSSSRKSKANFQEARDSPVESVSSSPFRNLGKDDPINVGYSMMGSPRRFSDGEADGACYPFGSKQNGSLDLMRLGDIQIRESDLYATKAKDLLITKIFGCTDDEPTPSEYNDIIRGDAAMINHDQQKKCNIEHQGKSHDLEQDKHDIGVHTNGSNGQKKSGKSSSSWSRERCKNSKIDKGNMKASDEFSDQGNFNNEKYNRYEAVTGSLDRSTCRGDSNLDKKERKNYPKIDGGRSSEGKRNNCSNSRSQENMDVHGPSLLANKNSNSIVTESFGNGEKSYLQENHNMILPREGEQSSNHVFTDRMDKLEMNSGRVKSEKLPHSSEKQDSKSRASRPVKMQVNGSRSEVMSVKTENLDANNVLKQPIKIGCPNGANNNSLRQPTPSRLDGPGHIRKEGGPDKIVMKEARGLKHSANRLKEVGSELESTDMYFQAALKFLHVALLQEPSNFGDIARSIQMYSETAKLCEYCAHEYEKHKKMAAASLAYKCMEVAYMKVVYSKHSGTSKDFHELQIPPQMLLHGESPSSSASDVDNLNNSSLVDKTNSVKKVNSPQIAGNHVISARNRPNFGRLLGFAGNINSAMEASKKSLNAFEAASIEGIGVEALSSVKKVLDFSFHDVEGLLRLVRLSVELIARNSSE